jgi:hypothetical protein
MADVAFFHDRSRMLAYLHRMILLWAKGARSVWRARASAQVANGPLIYAHAARVAELSEGVETLYRTGQDFAAMPLIRSSMESAMTVAYRSSPGVRRLRARTPPPQGSGGVTWRT